MDIKDILKQAAGSSMRTICIGIGAGVITMAGYSFSIAGIGTRLFYMALLMAAATFMSGFFIGTLFGMPKRNTVNDSDYSLNNSLVEISDWLTKIIVGLGLVNIKQVPKYLMSMGDYVAGGTNNKGISLDVFAMCIVVYFGVFGLYTGYNYMRLVLSQKYKQADDNMLRKALQQKDEENKAIIDEANKTKASVPAASRDASLSMMKATAEQKLAAGKLKSPNDPQKGQWGMSAQSNGRQLEAEVKEFIKNLYSITLRVRSTDNDNTLTDGDFVLFALHDSFGSPPFRYVKVENGIAEIKLISYGSFTVGAMADHGDTQLELDLAAIPGMTAHFINN